MYPTLSNGYIADIIMSGDKGIQQVYTSYVYNCSVGRRYDGRKQRLLIERCVRRQQERVLPILALPSFVSFHHTKVKVSRRSR